MCKCLTSVLMTLCAASDLHHRGLCVNMLTYMASTDSPQKYKVTVMTAGQLSTEKKHRIDHPVRLKNTTALFLCTLLNTCCECHQKICMNKLLFQITFRYIYLHFAITVSSRLIKKYTKMLIELTKTKLKWSCPETGWYLWQQGCRLRGQEHPVWSSSWCQGVWFAQRHAQRLSDARGCRKQRQTGLKALRNKVHFWKIMTFFCL